jgi:hypothetical protein
MRHQKKNKKSFFFFHFFPFFRFFASLCSPLLTRAPPQVRPTELPHHHHRRKKMSTTVKVFCGNLPFSMSQDDLKAQCAAAGKVL